MPRVAAAGMRPENQMKIKSYYSRTVEDAMASRASGDGAGRDAGQQPQSAAGSPPSRRVRSGLCHRRRCRRGRRRLRCTLPGESAWRVSDFARPPATGSPRKSRNSRRNWKACGGPSPARPTRPAQWVGVSQDVSDAYAALTAAEVSAGPGPRDRAGRRRPLERPAVRRRARRRKGPTAPPSSGHSSRKLPAASPPMPRWAAVRHSRASSPWWGLPARARRPRWSNSR